MAAEPSKPAMRSEPFRDQQDTPSDVTLPAFHILVPVWGEPYCDIFTQISLPSQLAPGNLPSLPHKDRCLYHVLTRPEDEARIRSAESWRRLESVMPVRVELRRDKKGTSYETMSAYLSDGIALADKDDAASLFFNPDLIFSNGTIAVLVQKVRDGRRVVFTTGIRLQKESVIPEILEFRGDGAISVTSRDLASVALRNLHPLSRQNIWTDGNGTLLPATMLWPVGNEGLLARCFHLHPLLVWPERKNVVFQGTIDDDFVSMACPDAEADYVVTDSDDLLMCEISALSQPHRTRYRRGSTSDVVEWAELNTDSRHRRLATFPIRIHQAAMTEPLWAAAEADSSRVVDDVFGELGRSTGSLLFHSPMRLFRRWARRAATIAVSHRNAPHDNKWHSFFAVTYLGLYRSYSAFCAKYEAFRAKAHDALFGSPENPYPWNGHWFTTREPAHAAMQLAPLTMARTLVIARDSAVRGWLARRNPQAEFMAWPGVTTREGMAERWPYDDGTFGLMLCVGALPLAQKPEAFIAELSRVLKPGGYSILVTPSHADMAKLIQSAAAPTSPERSIGVGGLGSYWATRFHCWIGHQRQVQRLSPVILEIPIWPLLISLQLVAGCAAALAAKLCNVFDRSGRYHTHTAVLLRRS
jgi:hypothetical protein